MSKTSIAVSLICLFLLSTISPVHAVRPNLSVTVDGDVVNVEWEMKVVFEDLEAFEKKAKEIKDAKDNNYNRNLEKAVSNYLTTEFSDYLRRPVSVNVTYLTVTGDGTKEWLIWMKTTIHFTIKGLRYTEGNSEYIDMSWLTIKLRTNSTYGKVSFEDKKVSTTIYSFYPKYLLAMNWQDCFNWDLTARPSETTDEGIILTLPSRGKYDAYGEYPEVYCEPNRPQLRILVKNKEAVFETNRVMIPLPPREPSDTEKLVAVLPVVGAVFGLGIVALGIWVGASKVYASKKRHQDSKIEGQKKAIGFSDDLADWRTDKGMPRRQVYGGKGDFKIEKKPVSESFLKAHGFEVEYSLWEKIKKIIFRK